MVNAPSPDTAAKFTAKITYTSRTKSPTGKVFATGTYNKAGMLGFAKSYRQWVGYALLEQVTFPEMSCAGNCLAFGLAPVVRFEVQAVRTTGV